MKKGLSFRALGQRGFTLLEISVVLTIMGALMTIAMPAFSKYMRKAKTTEALANLESIRSMARSYYLDHRNYLSCAAEPLQVPGSTPVPWKGNSCWDDLGFHPEGSVRYQYEITVDDGVFTAHARGDLDGDGVDSHYKLLLDGIEISKTRALE